MRTTYALAAVSTLTAALQLEAMVGSNNAGDGAFFQRTSIHTQFVRLYTTGEQDVVKYIFHGTPSTWDNASSDCKTDGGDLVSIHS